MAVDVSAAGRDVVGPDAAWASCPDCGLGQRVPALAAGKLRLLPALPLHPGGEYRHRLDTVLAVALAALILLLFANSVAAVRPPCLRRGPAKLDF